MRWVTHSTSVALLLLTSCFRVGYEPFEDSHGNGGESALGGFNTGGGGSVLNGGAPSSGGAGSGGTTSGGVGGSSVVGSGGTVGGTFGGGAVGGGGTGGSSVGGAPGCVVGANCTCGTFQNKSYRFCTNLVVFADAQADCQSAGMQLVEVETAEEDAWLFSEMTVRGQFNVSTSAAVFLGGRDLLANGDWTWPDGTLFWSGGAAVAGTYSNWQRRPSGGAAPCMVMLDVGKWTNRSCNSGDVVHVCEGP